MCKDALQVLHVLATAILMLLAGQLKDICVQILEGHHVVRHGRDDGVPDRRVNRSVPTVLGE